MSPEDIVVVRTVQQDEIIRGVKMCLKLVKLGPEYKVQLVEMIEEWSADIKQNHTNHSPWAIFKNDCHDFDNYLANIEYKAETDEGRVPDSVFFCLDEERSIFVGAVDIRHYLNENICYTGGHIGDGIRPSERRKGYATKMIGLALEECRRLGINKVLMTCSKENIASKKSIIANGGVYEMDMEEDGEIDERYWITLYDEVVDTDRLIMRRLMASDYKEMSAWSMDERVYKYLQGNACKTPEEPLAWLPKKDPNSKDSILMLAREKSDGHAVGLYALNYEAARDVWTVSYVNRYDDWGKGYSTEGMCGMMKHVVQTYGAHSFEGECAKQNIGSARVMEKLGMVYDHDSTYTKRDGSVTYESKVYILEVK